MTVRDMKTDVLESASNITPAQVKSSYHDLLKAAQDGASGKKSEIACSEFTRFERVLSQHKFFFKIRILSGISKESLGALNEDLNDAKKVVDQIQLYSAIWHYMKGQKYKKRLEEKCQIVEKSVKRCQAEVSFKRKRALARCSALIASLVRVAVGIVCMAVL